MAVSRWDPFRELASLQERLGNCFVISTEHGWRNISFQASGLRR